MTAEGRAGAHASGPLGILAGSGKLPLEVAAAVGRSGRNVHIVGIQGFASGAIAGYPHTWVNLGQVGAMIKSFRQAGCREIVIAGGMRRPNLWKLKLDLGFFRSIGTVLKLTRGGDDSVLRKVVRFFELQGLAVCGVHEVAPQLLAPVGVLGSVRPDDAHRRAIAHGADLIRVLGGFDVGQAVVAGAHRVVAIEGHRGTDAMLEDVTGLDTCASGRSVLVKLPKPDQEMRIDLPVIGPQTIERAAAAGLAGVAVRGGQSLVLERTEMLRRADAAGLFVVGLGDGEAGPAAPALPISTGASAEAVPLLVIGRRAPTPSERRDVMLGGALMRALAARESGDAAVIAGEHILAVNAALPLEAVLKGIGAGSHWGRRVFRRRIGVLIVSRPEIILRGVRAAADTARIDFGWIARAGLAGIACVGGSLPTDLVPAVADRANAAGLFLMAPETSA